MDHNAKYYAEIDGLRAVAVIAVLLYHLVPEILPGGFVGVDIFFVISGYVVTASLARDKSQNLRKFLLHFYARRILRIAPALLVCLLTTALATTLFIPDAWLSKAIQKTGLYAFFGASNFALLWTSDGYFSPRAEYNPFLHTWSLAVEEQFYLLFPFVLYYWIKFRDQVGIASRLFSYLLPALTAGSLLTLFWLSGKDPDQAFYLLPSRFWELGLGSLIYKHQHARSASLLPRSVSSTALYLASAAVFASLVLADRGAFPLPWVFMPVIGAALLILLLTGTQDEWTNGVAQTLRSRPFVFIGKLSYSLYLWHWPVYVLLRWTTGLSGPSDYLIAIVASLLLAYLSYRFVERPIRSHKVVLRQPNWRTVAAGLSCILLFAQSSNMLFHARPHLSLSVTKQAEIWYPYAWPNHDAANSNCKVSVDASSLPHVALQSFIANACRNPVEKDIRLYVIGDSHAGAYTTMLYKLSEELGAEVHILQRAGCPFAGLMEATKPGCTDFVAESLKQVEESASPGDIVFLPGLRVARFGDHDSLWDMNTIIRTQVSDAASQRRQAALAEASRLLSHFEKAGLHVIIEAPKPVFPSPPFRCSDWFNSANPICSGGFSIERELMERYREPIMNSIRELTSAHLNVTVWDPLPTLCPRSTCSAFDHDIPLYFDGDHLSAYANRTLYSSFVRQLSSH